MSNRRSIKFSSPYDSTANAVCRCLNVCFFRILTENYVFNLINFQLPIDDWQFLQFWDKFFLFNTNIFLTY